MQSYCTSLWRPCQNSIISEGKLGFRVNLTWVACASRAGANRECAAAVGFRREGAGRDFASGVAEGEGRERAGNLNLLEGKICPPSSRIFLTPFRPSLAPFPGREGPGGLLNNGLDRNFCPRGRHRRELRVFKRDPAKNPRFPTLSLRWARSTQESPFTTRP